jgi:hypothetical protein
VIVAAFIATEKVAVGATPVLTPVLPAVGEVAVTVGAAGVSVENVQVYAAESAVPRDDFTPVERRAV